MGKQLVIVESPAKAKTIGKMLGKDYLVRSSMGHIRDLPEKRMGVDIEHSFKPQYVIVRGRKKTVDALRKEAKDCERIYLAPDPDREGEAIAWHLKELLSRGRKNEDFLRVQYNEVTPRAVKEAFENPGRIDMNRVDAQQARRILDRIVGYRVSPLLWRSIKPGLSAGRVQSVALRLVCEREQEIRKFVPEEYWLIGALVRKVVQPFDPFRIDLHSIDGKKIERLKPEEVAPIKGELEGRTLRITNIDTREVKRKAPPPFITSTLQQTASNYFQFSPKRTMALAQALYEGVDLGEGPVGLITYMRTDSVNVAREAISACRTVIQERFGKEYLPDQPNFYKSRSTAQGAHEAIRPTEVGRTPEQLSGRLSPAHLKLYRLIWQRFVASQMCPAVMVQHTVSVEAVREKEHEREYEFRAGSSEVKFPGYTKALPSKSKSDQEAEKQKLPPLEKGENLESLEWITEQKETKPPVRYSDASLIRALEAEGVGRPSTYAQIISTLFNRKYVSRENRSLVATELGEQVSDLLVKNLGKLFDVGFTASMEESLDHIESGSLEWTKMLAEFYEKFEEWVGAVPRPVGDKKTALRVLKVMEGVQEWAPEVKRGKRRYSDEKFCASLTEKLNKEEGEVSPRQVEALLKIACRYREQIPEVENVLKDVGRADILKEPSLQPPRESTARKLDLLRGADLDEGTADFVQSLRSRVEGNRSLSEGQLKALDRVVIAHREKIPGYEELKSELGIVERDEEEGREAGPLLEALTAVRAWKPPRKGRGGKLFDDKSFYESLRKHFEGRGYLTPRQIGALKRVVSRYRTEIPDYKTLADRFGLGKKGSSKK